MGNAEAERLSINSMAITSKPQTSMDASHGILLFIDDEAQWNIPPPQSDVIQPLNKSLGRTERRAISYCRGATLTAQLASFPIRLCTNQRIEALVMTQLRLVFPLLQRNRPSRRSFMEQALTQSTLNRSHFIALQQSQ